MNESLSLALTFGISAALSWGVSDFLAAKISKTIGPITSGLYANLVSLIGFFIYFLLFADMPGQVNGAGIIYSAGGGVLFCFAIMLFFNGLKVGPVSTVSPITAAYPAVTAIVVMLVFGVDLSLAQFGAILMVVVGVMAASGLFTLKKADRRIGRGPVLALVSAVFYGLSLALLAQGNSRLGWELNTLIQLIACTTSFVIFAPFFGRTERVFANAKRALTNKLVIATGTIGTMGFIFLMLGFANESSGGALVAAASACYPVITVILALKHFKEDLQFIPLFGAGLSIASIAMLSIL